ncbi:peptide chain release factor N(5)-glutamine methyltransferase [Enterococcus sp. HY326]|uniref:peptide chain release factor N(5)-glutamine methyltransferase n=1 Tax=Enterococcus sp. HY326 TaxID=2971265 RepID=UPI00223E97E4|nr:peptide chain release factor N(5)-glutamine methyltransferase [Enterococcus sp. HY326]
MAKTYREVLQRASSFLEAAGKEGYAIQFLFLERKGWSKTDWLLQMNEAISAADETQIAADMRALMENQPPQYLLGYADFYGRTFFVNQDTLIPRPETEELVELCLKENSSEKNLQVVDIGTGTGAIAITLKAEADSWQLFASDISEGALSVAKKNSQALHTAIDFRKGSVLEPFAEETFDLIISNPPYISQAEWDLMDESVRTYEPKSALFAAADGLAIYQMIAQQAPEKLKAGGKIYLEIGFQQGQAVKEIFEKNFPAAQITVKKDLTGLDRFVVIHT